MIVRNKCTLYRKFHFLFIQQYFHQNIIAPFFTIKHELDVASHRENLVIAPDLGKTIQIGSLISAIAQLQQTCERKYTRFMTESQCNAVLFFNDTGSRSIQNVLQQIGFQIGHFPFCQRRRTVIDIPICVIQQPHVVTLLFCKKRIEFDIRIVILHNDCKFK